MKTTCEDLGLSCGVGCTCGWRPEKPELPKGPEWIIPNPPRKPPVIYVKFDRRYHGRQMGSGVVKFEGYKSALEALAAWGTSAPQWEYRVTQVSDEPIDPGCDRHADHMGCDCPKES